jgi:uncharacterized membrane protein YcaP (DUF421 family)
MSDMFLFFQSILGLGVEPKSLNFLQISLRGVIVFIAALIMVRFSDRRSLTKKSPFDILLVVILASVLARPINGSAAFFPTIGGAIMLVLLHRLLAFCSCRFPRLTKAIKGQPWVLVRNGQLHEDVIRRKDISRADVEEDMRLNAKIEGLEKVKIARLEVNGEISFILDEAD